MVELPAFQPEDSGSIPTRALHFRESALHEAKEIVERVHYSHSLFGVTCSCCFVAEAGRRVVGAAVFGLPSGAGVAEKYSGGRRLLELRRFVMEDFCPKNSESRFIGFTLRELRRRGVGVVLAYSDPGAGHTGTIYRATGFKYLGRTSPRRHLLWRGKKYPDRNLHQTNFPFHLVLRAAVEKGKAKRVKVPGKHVFVKSL